MLRGKLRSAVRWIIERETGGVLQPSGRCEKTGDQVLEVLRAKHPEARLPTSASLTPYTGCPQELTLVYITDDTVTAVAGGSRAAPDPEELIQCHCNTGSSGSAPQAQNSG